MMKCFSFLQIEPTKDVRAIKRAYSKLLPIYHPEKDNEGFIKLREAYEEALEYANMPDEETVDKQKTPVEQWIQKVEEVYNDYARRIDVSEWERLLDEDVCVAIDSSNECNEELLIFIADHAMIPHEVLNLLESFFHWESRKDQLSETFPSNYIEYLCANAKYPDNFRYMLLDTKLNIDYDAFFDCYFALERDCSNQNLEHVQTAFDAVNRFGITHPDLYQLYVRTMVLLQKDEDAGKYFEQYLLLETDEDRKLNFEAKYYLETRQYEKAIPYYDQIIEQHPDQVGAMLARSACYKELGDYNTAMDLAKQAQKKVPYDGYVRNYLVMLNEEMVESKKAIYEQDPSDQSALFEYCTTLADAYRFDEALELLPLVDETSLSKRDYNKLCSSVYMDVQNDNTKQAIPYLENLIEMEPDNLSYLEDLGYCYGEVGRLQEAKEIYQKAKTIDESSPRIYYRLAQIYIKEENYEDAIRVCDEGLSYHDDVPNLYHFKAEAYFYMQDYVRAMECCNHSISLMPYIDTYEIKAKIYNEVEEFEEVETMLKDMVGTDFMSGQLCAQLAKAKRRLGKSEEAKALLDEAIENGTMEAEVYYQRGIIAFAEAEEKGADLYEEAIKYANEALSHMKEFELGYLMLKCHSLIRLGKREDAFLAYKEYEKDNMSERLASIMGDLKMELGDAKVALEYYRRAYLMNENSYQIHGRLCDALMEIGEMENALKEVNLQLEIMPSDYYYIDRGIIYNELGDKLKAKSDYKKAIEDNENNCYAWSNLAFVLRDQGLLDEALKAYKKAVDCDHPNGNNLYELAKILERMDRHQAAIDYLKQYGEKHSLSYRTQLLLADLLGEKKESIDEALQYYENLVEQYPDQTIELVNHMANMYKHLHQYEEMMKVWEKYAPKNYKKQYAYNQFMAMFYEDYKDDFKKALKYFKKAHECSPENSYIVDHIGVMYEALGKEEKAIPYYEMALASDLEYQKENPEYACAYDNVAMDYARLKDYNQAMIHFSRTIYYGPTCEHCHKQECVEVYYDLGDMFERMAKAIRKKQFHINQKGASELLVTKEKADIKSRIDDENAFYKVPEHVLEKVYELFEDYLSIATELDCYKLSYKYYKRAFSMRADKFKYQKAVKRLESILKVVAGEEV